MAVLEGMLYVAGGNDGTSCLNSVERYNPKTNTWEGVAPMNIRRFENESSPKNINSAIIYSPSCMNFYLLQITKGDILEVFFFFAMQ